ncbi:MAG: hypothetical protein BWY59_01321 [Verrucomicrobia bacterium ADurb.Bin345]|nr:MAG: hypothetical protein BWY59_01321 [Verrucomicrobia bacterium ADurb.Bin345]
MPEHIKLNKKLGIIEVDSHDKVSYEEGVASLASLQTLMAETGIRKVLVDTRRQKFNPDLFKVYDFGKRLPNSAQIAVMVSQKQPTREAISLLNDVAHNRGVNVRVFGSRSEALEWLHA